MKSNNPLNFPKILGTATLNDKGQLVIPSQARKELDLSPGTKVVILSHPSRPGLVILKAEAVEALVKDLDSALNS
jgi:AbrB family looped-hinge helix DNA binding protein